MAKKPTTPPQGDYEELLAWAWEGIEKGSRYRGMTYEEGVRDVLEWIMGNAERPDRQQ
jgi:hypothetical protein